MENPPREEAREIITERPSTVRVQWLAVISSNYGEIAFPEKLPDDYSYKEIHKTGSRPWGIIRLSESTQDNPRWNEVIESLPENEYLFHEVVLSFPQDPDTSDVFKQFLKQNPLNGIDYEDLSMYSQGDKSFLINTNQSHLTRSQVVGLLELAELFAEERRKVVKDTSEI